MEVAQLQALATQVRRDILRMVHAVQSGHPGGSLGCTDFLVALYFEVMQHQPQAFDMDAKNQDAFFLSNGHVSPVFYSVLARSGYFPIAELGSFRKLNSRLQGHPTTHEHLPGVRIASGSLGQGLSVACGAALSKKINKEQGTYVYALLGDGELNEGLVWEAAMSAAHYKLGNLTAIIDFNGLQIDGKNDDVMAVKPVDKKFESFGWNVILVDGHDMTALMAAFEAAKQVTDKPTVLLASTVKGKGVSFMENQVGWHGKAPSDDELAAALKELGGDK